MKAIEQYFHVVLFIMLHKVVLTFKSVETNLRKQLIFVLLYTARHQNQTWLGPCVQLEP